MKKITFLLVLLTVSTVTLSAQSIGMIGSFPASGWTSDIVMKTTDNQNYNLDSYTFLDACQVKFRQGGAWTINWGGPNFPSGVGIQDGVNIPVPAGNYKISFNITTGAYNFTKLNPTQIPNSAITISSFGGLTASAYFDNNRNSPRLISTTCNTNVFFPYAFMGEINNNDYIVIDLSLTKYITNIKFLDFSCGFYSQSNEGNPQAYIPGLFGYTIYKSTTPNGPWTQVIKDDFARNSVPPFDLTTPNINSTSRYWKITFDRPYDCPNVGAYFSEIQFYGIESVLVPSPPTGSASQTVCNGATLANLTVTGSGINWYSSSADGSSLPPTTLVNNGATYYASQNVNGIESVDRLAVTTTIQNTSAPTGLSSQSLAKGLTISAIQVVGSNIKWYANQSNANKYINPLPTSTVLVNGNTYYATQTINGCESTTSLGVLINLTIGLTDVDGNIYNTVDICNQTWMKENLNVSKYKNGDVIPGPLTASEWRNTTSGGWKWAYNSQNSGYGKLYNWYAVIDSRGLAPEGWHIPSDVDYTTLTDCLGGKDIAGIKMKEAGNIHWINNSNATNESGFTALPSGYIYVAGQTTPSTSLGYFCFLWSSSNDVTVFRLYNNYDSFSSQTDISQKNYGYAVRCIKNSNLSNEIFKNKECFISPNPTHSILNLSVNEGIKIDKVTIVDVTGKVVLEQTENLSKINVEQLAKGVYILTAYAGDKKYQEKFIKE